MSPESNIPNKDSSAEKRSSIRTYESDAAEALKSKDASLSGVFLAEQQKKTTEVPSLQTKPSRTFFYIILALIFTAIAAGLLFFAWKFLNKDNDVKLENTSFNQAVIADTDLKIETEKLSAAEIENEMLKMTQSLNSELGNVSTFIFKSNKSSTTAVLSSKQIVNALSWRMGGALLRSLADKYSIGFYDQKEKEFFAVFSLNSYEGAFAGSLEWEKYMYDDLKPFLEQAGNSQNSTSTPVLTFKDKVVENKDARLLAIDGNTVLVYSFPDRKTLLVASNEATFREILSRLSSR